MNKTPFEKGFEKGFGIGLEKGIDQFRRRALHEVLEARFGSLEQTVRAKLDQTPANRLPTVKQANRASSLRELGLVE